MSSPTSPNRPYPPVPDPWRSGADGVSFPSDRLSEERGLAMLRTQETPADDFNGSDQSITEPMAHPNS
ncbi:MAG: hypothetical protein LH702_27460, partial [Phormidesmis sp. CAN_BIN44]|nr:hypothetical protein [Phormidesmis sp. CAN_BIN44]